MGIMKALCLGELNLTNVARWDPPSAKQYNVPAYERFLGDASCGKQSMSKPCAQR